MRDVWNSAVNAWEKAHVSLEESVDIFVEMVKVASQAVQDEQTGAASGAGTCNRHRYMSS